MALPTIDGSPVSNGNVSSATTLSTSSGLTTTLTNDVVIVAVQVITTGTATSTAVTSPHLTFTKYAEIDHAGGFSQLELWWAPAPALLSSEVITVTVGTAAYLDIIAFAVNGCSLTSPWDPNGSLPAMSAAGPSSLTISTSNANDMILAICARDGVGTLVTPSGQTGIASLSEGSKSAINAAYLTETAPQSGLAVSSATGGTVTMVVAALTAGNNGTPGQNQRLMRYKDTPMSVYRTSTGLIFRFKIYDSTKTDGSGLTGLVYNSSGLVCAYSSDGAAATAVVLSAGTVGTWSSGGFKEIDATNLPGWYEFGIPNAALSASGQRVQIHLHGATNMYAVDQTIELVGYNPQDSTALGLTRLDAAVSTRMAAFTLPTNFSTLALDASGRVTLTPAEHTNIQSDVTTATNALLPAGFSTLAITSGGVTVTNISAIVSGVWDEPVANHQSAGSTADTLSQGAQQAGTPWTRIY
jgi:hypothetical protein